MNLNWLCLAGLLVLASAGSALAQDLTLASTDSTGRIVGNVTALTTGASIPAWVTLVSLKGERHQRSMVVRADSSGRFSLERLQPGGYVLKAAGAGTGDAQVLATVASGGTTFIDVAVPPIGYDVAERMKQLEQLSEARERWIVEGPLTYQFTVRRECFCFGANQHWGLEVQADSTFALNSERGTPEVPAELAGMERIFDQIEAEIRDPSRSVEVTYNRRLGYPERVRFDTLELLSDSWQTIIIRDVKEVRQRE